MTHRFVAGMTLIELLVVLALLALLAAFTGNLFFTSTAESRDAERQGDLRVMQAAIELYKQDNGRYPEGCNGPGQWSGESGSSFACADGSSRYILGLAPEYTPSLPTDPRAEDGQDEGYAYVVNSAGTVYRFMIRNTVETERIDWFHPLRSCEVAFSSTPDAYVCNSVQASGNNTPTWCTQSNTQFETSYAVWGGYDSTTNTSIAERRTEDIYCKQ